MTEKTSSSKKKLKKFNVPLTAEKCSDKEDVKATGQTVNLIRARKLVEP